MYRDGYDLDGIREYDLRLNGGRTHIVESYAFERDLLVDLPLELASSEAFASDGTLRELVRSWQRGVPMRALKGPAWRRPGAFYVHVGTEDSLGSSLPPGTMALVEPIEEEEARQSRARPTEEQHDPIRGAHLQRIFKGKFLSIFGAQRVDVRLTTTGVWLLAIAHSPSLPSSQFLHNSLLAVSDAQDSRC